MLARLPDILTYLFPQGRTKGDNYEIGNIRGEPEQSLKIGLYGDKAGLWHDFATGEGGDIFDLWAACHNFDCSTEFKKVLGSAPNFMGTQPAQPHTYLKTQIETGQWHYRDIEGNPIVAIGMIKPIAAKSSSRGMSKQRNGECHPSAPSIIFPVSSAMNILFLSKAKNAPRT